MECGDTVYSDALIRVSTLSDSPQDLDDTAVVIRESLGINNESRRGFLIETESMRFNYLSSNVEMNKDTKIKLISIPYATGEKYYRDSYYLPIHDVEPDYVTTPENDEGGCPNCKSVYSYTTPEFYISLPPSVLSSSTRKVHVIDGHTISISDTTFSVDIEIYRVPPDVDMYDIDTVCVETNRYDGYLCSRDAILVKEIGSTKKGQL
jgi:hypothetical protein